MSEPNPVVQYDAVLLPTLNLTGWDGQDDVPDSLEPIRLAQAMDVSYDTDAMFQPLAIPGAPAAPRLNKGGVVRLLSEGIEPVLTWAVVDLDNPGHKPWPDRDSAVEAAAAVHKRLSGLLGPPTVYTTNAGLRVLWALPDPLPVTLASSWLRALHAVIKPLVAKFSLELDATCDEWSRVYRLPRVVREGRHMDPHVIPGGAIRWQPPKPPTAEVIRASAGRAGEYDDVPPTRALSSDEWLRIPEKWRTRLKAGDELFVAHGNPGHDTGTMCHLLPQLSAAMAKVEVPDPELIYQAVRASIERQTWPPLDRVWARIQDFASNDTEHYAMDRTIHAAVYQQALATGNQETVDRVRDAVAPTSSRAETRQAAQEAAERGEPILVHNGDSRASFLRYPGDGIYRLKAKDALGPLIERLHGVDMRNSKGRFLTFTDMFNEVGVDAHEVRLRYWRPGATESYDAEKCVLWKHTPAPPVDPRPVYNPYIAAWLELLPEDATQHARLLDWFQSAPDVTKPIAALVLVGPPGIGKTMLAQGIGSGWGYTGNYNLTVGQAFNDDVGKSPVLAADEGLRVDGDHSVEGFKSLITERRHTLKMKYLNNASVEGCVRVIIGANKVDDVQVSSDITPESLAALEERILFVACSGKAAAYLATVGTDGWVTCPKGGPGAIFNHALWLAENRKLSKPPGRLLVYGESDGRWRTRRLSNAGGLDGAALVALATWLSEGRLESGIGGHPEYPGKVLVNPTHLRSKWIDLTKDRFTPQLRTLANTLATLSGGGAWPKQLTVNNHRLKYYAVDAELVMQTAENCAIGDEARMRQFLRAMWAPTEPMAGNRPAVT